MLFSQSIGRLGRPQKNKFNPRVPMQAPQKPIGLDRAGSQGSRKISKVVLRLCRQWLSGMVGLPSKFSFAF